MKKRILKFLNDLFNKAIVKALLYVIGVFTILLIYGVFDPGCNSYEKIKSIIKDEVTLSVLLASLISLIISTLVKKGDCYLEESQKIDDNHHKIIHKYSAHKKLKLSACHNYASAEGTFMSIRHTKSHRKSELKNHEKDVYSKQYQNFMNDVEDFNQGILYLPTLNLFTNIDGTTKIVFQDENTPHNLPSFVIQNGHNLLNAHKNSKISNSLTIRLTSASYENDVLTLKTQRSNYYHMLITNRCMDYEFSDNMTIRSLYEYNSNISLLEDSKLSNQIGINGLILSKDGYVLIEKRDYKKTTWKNKFSQSISLAMKKADLLLDGNQTIGNTAEDALNNLKHIITKTIKSNYGLTEKDYETFIIEKNFLGLARDLLEGGKPNLYFYVTTKYTAKELKSILEKAASDDNYKTALKTEKLSSDYYLVPYKDLHIGFNYTLKLNRRKCYKIARRVYPRSKRRHYLLDQSYILLAKLMKPGYIRECSEALLVCISYLELCSKRIDSIQTYES